MPINKTQEFLYFQNKAKHYDTIKNIKSSVKDKLEQKYLKTLSFLNNEKDEKAEQKKKKRFIPLMKEIDIKEENEKMISRLLKMYKSQRTQVNAQGNYSRFNKQQRPFRHSNPYNTERNRSISIDNNGMKQRINKIKPCVGNSSQWNKHFGRSLELKKNMSRYLIDDNRSRGSLHISVVDSFVPRYYGAFLGDVQRGNANDQASLLKEIQVTRDVILTLPDIKSKSPQFAHSVKHHKNKRKLLIDSSRSSLHSVSNKTHQTINPEKMANTNNNKKQQQNQQNLFNFKFFQHDPNGQKQKNINIENEEVKKTQH